MKRICHARRSLPRVQHGAGIPFDSEWECLDSRRIPTGLSTRRVVDESSTRSPRLASGQAAGMTNEDITYYWELERDLLLYCANRGFTRYVSLQSKWYQTLTIFATPSDWQVYLLHK